MPGTVLLRQIFGGKRRRYSPANKREQQEENRQRHALGHIRRGPAQRQHMKQDIGAGIESDQRADGRPVPDSRCRNLAPNDGGQGGKKGRIHDGGNQRNRPRCDDQPSGQPQDAQRHQEGASHGCSTGPVGNRGQDKAGHRGGQEPEQHLVDVPLARSIEKVGADRAGHDQDPGRHGDAGEQCGAEEERSEPIGEKRRAIVRRQGRFILRPGCCRLADSYFDRFS